MNNKYSAALESNLQVRDSMKLKNNFKQIFQGAEALTHYPINPNLVKDYVGALKIALQGGVQDKAKTMHIENIAEKATNKPNAN